MVAKLIFRRGLTDVSWSYRQVGEARSRARAYRMSAGDIGRVGKLIIRRGLTGCQLDI